MLSLSIIRCRGPAGTSKGHLLFHTFSTSTSQEKLCFLFLFWSGRLPELGGVIPGLVADLPCFVEFGTRGP